MEDMAKVDAMSLGRAKGQGGEEEEGEGKGRVQGRGGGRAVDYRPRTCMPSM